jgi:hypothetical protein
VRYVDSQGAPREIKLFYKFDVHAPFTATLSSVPAQSHLNPLSTGTVVTAVVRNVTPHSLCLGKAAFQCRPHCFASLLSQSVKPLTDSIQATAGSQAPQGGNGDITKSTVSSLPSWIQRLRGPVVGSASTSGGAGWLPSVALSNEPLLMPGQDVQYSFMVVRHVVQPTRGDASRAAVGASSNFTYISSCGATPPVGYEAKEHTVVHQADATLGHLTLQWVTHMGEAGLWRSAKVASSASCPQVCHIVSARSLSGHVMQPILLPVCLTHLPPADSTGEGQEYTLRLCSKSTEACAVLGEELVRTGKLQACAVAPHTFQCLPLSIGTHKLEVVVSLQVAESEDSACVVHEMDRPLKAGRPIAWNNIELVVT